MRVIDLTLPLYEGMPYGDIYPFETPFRIEMFGNSRMKREIYHMNGEPGTRRMMGSGGLKIEDGNIVLQDVAIVHIGPKGAGEQVTIQDIERGVAQADIHEGDGLIFHTGWGDDERWRKMGLDWELMCPYYGVDEVFQKIAEVMVANKSKLFCYDTANAYNMRERWKTWIDKKPKPKSWPSDDSKEWLEAWEKDESIGPPVVPGKLLGRLGAIGATYIGAVVNVGAIKKPRVKLIALPLKILGVGLSPCNVIAIEE